MAHTLATEMMRTPELALETHAREELGIDPGSLGNPIQAALSSFSTFALGALIPLIPWLITRGGAATVASIAAGAVAALVVGSAVALFTNRSRWRSAVRQLAILATVAAITYGIGAAVGVSGVHG